MEPMDQPTTADESTAPAQPEMSLDEADRLMTEAATLARQMIALGRSMFGADRDLCGIAGLTMAVMCKSSSLSREQWMEAAGALHDLIDPVRQECEARFQAQGRAIGDPGSGLIVVVGGTLRRG